MTTIEDLTNLLVEFREARDWEKFHNTKDLELSIVVELGELFVHSQWKTPEEITEHLKTHKKEVSDELADVFSYLLILSHDFGIDLGQALINKIQENGIKYPIDKCKGKHNKYTEL